ncbi:hypothetical protein EOI86_21405 [Hwanghaeella grinnelliae]|uniref:Uncharacterized protein n=1 Tax=Hwanghaeella grinnelliae TaxID=2500179 RepID=A0A437QI58_9PROT|nr:hypothetical protein EOI86_21405 [Hwanghaeella grinnelliae]
MRQVLFGAVALIALTGQGRAAGDGERIQVTGEIMDTWCYLSGVMGGPEATLGTAHHTCAMWCAAGGIPVGLRTEEGEIYMVLKLEGAGTADGSPAVLEIQSNQITADGMAYARNGINYLIVERIVSNEGITNVSHEDYGLVPPFAIPKGEKKKILGSE